MLEESLSRLIAEPTAFVVMSSSEVALTFTAAPAVISAPFRTAASLSTSTRLTATAAATPTPLEPESELELLLELASLVVEPAELTSLVLPVFGLLAWAFASASASFPPLSLFLFPLALASAFMVLETSDTASIVAEPPAVMLE